MAHKAPVFGKAPTARASYPNERNGATYPSEKKEVPPVKNDVQVFDHSDLDALLARAESLPEEITNPIAYVNGERLAMYPSFHIVGARVRPGNAQFGDSVDFTVVLPKGYETRLLHWTPTVSPERLALVALFERNPNRAIGPVHVQAVMTNNGATYYRLHDGAQQAIEDDSDLPF